MLHLSPAVKYYLYTGNTDMRKGFDSLCGIISSQMELNALCGAVFIFINKKRNQVKLLLLCKRLHKSNYANKEIMQIYSFKMPACTSQFQ